MYPYHNKIKQRIKAAELTGIELVTDYPRIGTCMILKFNAYPFERPIRPYRFEEYVEPLKAVGIDTTEMEEFIMKEEVIKYVELNR